MKNLFRITLLRALCLFLCLAALLAAVPACSAEVSGAAAFADGASAFFRTFNPEQEALRLTVEPPEGDSLSGTLSLKDGLLSLEADLPNGPAALRIGSEAIWLSANGAVYELRYADFAKRPASLDEESLVTWREIFALFGSRVLLPGLHVEQSGETLTVRLSYTAETMLPALAEFGDSVVASDRYLGAILSALNAYARSTGQQGLTADAVRAAWPEAREELLALPETPSLTGTVTASADSFGGNLAFSLAESAYTLSFSGKDREGKAEFSAALAAPEGEAAAMRFLCDHANGTFEGSASLPLLRDEIRLEGKRDSGFLSGEANMTSRGAPLLDIRLFLSDADLPRRKSAASGQLVIEPRSGRILGGQSFVVDFDRAPGRFRAAISGGGRSAAVRWSWSKDGRFSGSFDLPNSYFSAALSGRIRKGTLHAEGSVRGARFGSAALKLDYSKPEQRFSLEGTAGANKGSLSFSWNSGGGFEIAADGSLANGVQFVPVTARASGMLRPGVFSMDYELNYLGKRASGSLSANRAGKNLSILGTLNLFREKSTLSFRLNRMDDSLAFGLYGGPIRITGSLSADGDVKIRQSGEDRMERLVTGGFDETGDYLLDMAVIVGAGYAPIASRESHLLLRVSAGDGERLSLTLTEEFIRRSPDGTVNRPKEPEQIFAAALSRIPAEAAKPLTGQETVRLTPELLMQLLKDGL